MQDTLEMYPRICRFRFAALELMAALDDIAAQPQWWASFQPDDWGFISQAVMTLVDCDPSVALDAVVDVLERQIEWPERRAPLIENLPVMAALVERLNAVIRTAEVLERDREQR